MADIGKLIMTATILPDEVQKVLTRLSYSYTPATDDSEGWYYKMVDVTTSSGDLIGAETFMQKGTSAAGVDVGADDIDAGTGDDSEETLRQIFDMLKDYFEGSEESTPKAPAKPKADNGGDKDDDKGGEDDKDKKDAKEKIAEIIRRQKRKNLRESKTKRKKRSIVSRGRRKVSNRKPLVERFKKLANIIK